MMYKLLVEKGYRTENIFVISADGTSQSHDITIKNPFNTITQNLDLDGNGIDDIAYAATKANISSVFDIVKTKIELGNISHDISNVFIYTTDHGGMISGGTTSADVRLALWNQVYMSPYEFIVELKKLKTANFIQLLMDQCASGGFSDEIKKDYSINVATTTSCAYNQNAQALPDEYGIFPYHWICAIRGINFDGVDILSLADKNSDGHISFQEAEEYAKLMVKKYNMTPQYYSNPLKLGSLICIENIKFEAFCNNGIVDYGETGVDCGGSCGNTCGGVIIINPPVPKSETCDDGIKNQDETGTDCGGANCQPCGFGGGLNDIASVSECKYRDDQIVPFGNAPSMFSGSNILTTDNLKLSHGGLTISYKRGDFDHKVPTSWCPGLFPLFYNTESYHIYPEAVLLQGSGIFFEESGYKFKPNISYKITFNFRPDMIYDNSVKGSYRYGQLHFSLANDLTDFTVTKNYYSSTENYFFSSDKNDIPFLSNQFYIGNINRVDNECWGTYGYYSYDEGSGHAFYHGTPNRYNEVSITFKPDDFYKQLWIFTSNNSSIENFNSLKIEECVGDGSIINYSQDLYIQNKTITGNQFFGGKNIYVGNHVTTSQTGDVLISNGANVIFDCETITFDAGFECASGSSYEVKNH